MSRRIPAGVAWMLFRSFGSYFGFVFVSEENVNSFVNCPVLLKRWVSFSA